MKRVAAILVLFSLGLFSLTPCPALGSVNIFANPQVGEQVVFTGGNGVNDGGPFLGTLSDGSTWSTFCVEADGSVEWFVPGAQYNVLSTNAVTATASGNTVTNEAKWLYWQYGTNPSAITAVVDGVVHTYDDSNLAKAELQEAIWKGVDRPDAHGGGRSSIRRTAKRVTTWLRPGTPWPRPRWRPQRTQASICRVSTTFWS